MYLYYLLLASGSAKRNVAVGNFDLKASKPSTKKESILPSDDRINPYIGIELQTSKCDRLKQISSTKAHNMAISGMKFHPKKQVLATVSDDKSWKMWAFPSGELIMSGEGHKDWIADCDFHPRYYQKLMEI